MVSEAEIKGIGNAALLALLLGYAFYLFRDAKLAYEALISVLCARQKIFCAIRVEIHVSSSVYLCK